MCFRDEELEVGVIEETSPEMVQLMSESKQEDDVKYSSIKLQDHKSGAFLRPRARTISMSMVRGHGAPKGFGPHMQEDLGGQGWQSVPTDLPEISQEKEGLNGVKSCDRPSAVNQNHTTLSQDRIHSTQFENRTPLHMVSSPRVAVLKQDPTPARSGLLYSSLDDIPAQGLGSVPAKSLQSLWSVQSPSLASDVETKDKMHRARGVKAEDTVENQDEKRSCLQRMKEITFFRLLA